MAVLVLSRSRGFADESINFVGVPVITALNEAINSASESGCFASCYTGDQGVSFDSRVGGMEIKIGRSVAIY